MTVPNTIAKSGPYHGDGVTTVFNYDFRILDKTHIKVTTTNVVTGAVVVLVLDSDYSVNNVGQNSGSILKVSPLVSGLDLLIERDVPFTQETDLQNQGAYYAETVEDALDLATMRSQQLREGIDQLNSEATPIKDGLMSAADKAKLNGIEAGAQVNTVTSVAGKTGAVTLAKGDVGLGNVDNTSDANKPVSTAQAAADTAALNSAKSYADTQDAANLASAKAYTDSKATKSAIGLGNVDNTSDANKPVSTAQAAADAATLNSAKAYTDSKANKASVGLGNVDNTSDLNKPISTATQTALNAKADTASLGSAAFQPSTAFATAAQGAKADTAVQGVQAGTNIVVDNTDPLHPKITAVGSAVGGDVTGPAGGVLANEVALFDGTTGKLIKGSGIQSTNMGTVKSIGLSAPTGLSVSGSPVTSSGTLAITYTAGYQGYTSAEATKLAGIAAGAQPGTVTSVDMTVPAFLSVSGGPITGSGTFVVGLSGTALPAANGGTGQISYTIGDLLVASSTSALSKLAGVATGNVLISGGVGAAPSWGKVGLTTHVSGTLAVANGGTGATALATAGNVQAGAAFIPTMDVVLSAMGWGALADAATINVDHSNGVNRAIGALGGNRTIANPTNPKIGWPLNFTIPQDATGGRTMSWAGNFSFGAAGAPVLSSAPNATDLVCFVCVSATKYVFTGIVRGI